MSAPHQASGYLHGFTTEEQGRLYRQARIIEHRVHVGLPFHRAKRLLEVGCGVGAQTEILLRHFPELAVTGVDASQVNLQQAEHFLGGLSWAKDRFRLVPGGACAAARPSW